jgi:DNA-directed RNA polymerase subunit RPC12/RpoP
MTNSASAPATIDLIACRFCKGTGRRNGLHCTRCIRDDAGIPTGSVLVAKIDQPVIATMPVCHDCKSPRVAYTQQMFGDAIDCPDCGHHTFTLVR